MLNHLSDDQSLNDADGARTSFSTKFRLSWVCVWDASTEAARFRSIAAQCRNEPELRNSSIHRFIALIESKLDASWNDDRPPAV
jgi:hypothetical protein